MKLILSNIWNELWFKYLLHFLWALQSHTPTNCLSVCLFLPPPVALSVGLCIQGLSAAKTGENKWRQFHLNVPFYHNALLSLPSPSQEIEQEKEVHITIKLPVSLPDIRKRNCTCLHKVNRGNHTPNHWTWHADFPITCWWKKITYSDSKLGSTLIFLCYII